jgi:hypothetical protein
MTEKAKARKCFNRCGCNPAAAGFENNQSTVKFASLIRRRRRMME